MTVLKKITTNILLQGIVIGNHELPAQPTD